MIVIWFMHGMPHPFSWYCTSAGEQCIAGISAQTFIASNCQGEQMAHQTIEVIRLEGLSISLSGFFSFYWILYSHLKGQQCAWVHDSIAKIIISTAKLILTIWYTI